jgi:hypothetical protein
MLLKEGYKGRKDEKEEVSNYWVTLNKLEKMLEAERGSARSHSLEN